MLVLKTLCRKGLPVLSSKKPGKCLTDLPKTLENRVAYLISFSMAERLTGSETPTTERSSRIRSALAALGMSAALVAPEGAAQAADKSPEPVQITATVKGDVDCVVYAEAKSKTPQEQEDLFFECEGQKSQAELAEAKAILAALQDRLKALDMRIDAQGRIMDGQERELARLVQIEGQLYVRLNQVDKEFLVKLDEFEAYLNSQVSG